ncbi:hypothetical protein LOAG_14912 [Loa loa]|uniref:Uncharacterized protein n=1 Tax=Loa loa TaxID=7209 RepID=A0A1S0THC8_LOALO|nr:hypothetical protein LOAG_14912 [Loa loa]EFO13616.1 hypothetical protein LOAG_14912 [Loa loa]
MKISSDKYLFYDQNSFGAASQEFHHDRNYQETVDDIFSNRALLSVCFSRCIFVFIDIKCSIENSSINYNLILWDYMFIKVITKETTKLILLYCFAFVRFDAASENDFRFA